MMRIFLIGYMGSGKSMLAKALSDHLSYDLIDTDSLIEYQFGQTVNFIFENKGEHYFRELESKVLFGLSEKENLVVATGGGLPCYNENIKSINKFGSSFYLYQNSKNLTDRLFLEKDHRPLVRKFEKREALSAFVSEHIEKREKYYFQAHFILNGDQDINSLVEDVISFTNNNSEL